MDNLPYEILFEILVDMDNLTFSNYCMSSSEKLNICKDEYLNKLRSEKYLKQYLPLKTDYESWYDFYRIHNAHDLNLGMEKFDFNTQYFMNKVIMSDNKTLISRLLKNSLEKQKNYDIGLLYEQEWEIEHRIDVVSVEKLKDKNNYLIRFSLTITAEGDILYRSDNCEIIYNIENKKIKYNAPDQLNRIFEVFNIYFQHYKSEFLADNTISATILDYEKNGVEFSMEYEDVNVDGYFIFNVTLTILPYSILFPQTWKEFEQLKFLYGDVKNVYGNFELPSFYVLISPNNEIQLLDDIDGCFKKMIDVLSFDFIKTNIEDIGYDLYLII